MNPWLASPERAQPRRLVRESWERASRGRLDPEHIAAAQALAGDELEQYRSAHPLAAAMPMVRRLLVADADDTSGVVVAVGDAAGRLLWVEGDRALRGRAEDMGFVAGADWSERQVGTSAPGTALQLDHGIQIDGPEHFAAVVRSWSCTAVPVHDLETHEIIGVIDLTGGGQVVAPHTLPLLEATAAAVERELLVQRLQAGARRRPRHAPVAARAPRLQVLGRDTGALTVGGRTTELSRRHAEMLTLLAWHRAGIAADDLADLLFGRPDAGVTVRAEMVRLKRLLADVAPALVPLTRPYRLAAPIDVDAAMVVGLLDRGAHRAAVQAYPGPVLPASTAPGIEAIRDDVAARLRESMLESAAPDTLLAFAQTPAARDDVEVWRTALALLPARSPKRAGVVAHLQRLG